MLKPLEGLQKWGHVLLQLLLGFIFAMHGAQKFFGPSFYGLPWERYVGIFNSVGLTPGGFWLWIVTMTELIGGPCIFFGFLTRFWAAGLVIDMTVAVSRIHIPVGFFWQVRPPGGFEFPLTLGLIALTMFLMGPSVLSLDRAIGLERRTA